MKYIVIDRGRNEAAFTEFTEEFATAKEAIKRATRDWNYLTDGEKKMRTVLVLESINPDEEAEDHFDGWTIWRDGEEIYS